MPQENSIQSELRRIIEPFLKSVLGPDFLDRLAVVRNTLAHVDWVATQKRLEELPTKSKAAMALASSKGWFFGWHESLAELFALVDRLAVIKQSHIDEVMGQYYRDNLDAFSDELVEKHPNRATVIKAAVRAHRELGADGYFLSIPVFIAQADGLLAEIAGVKSAMTKAKKENKTGELEGPKALREKLSTDQKALDLLHPVLKLHELDFMKSASAREKATRASGEVFTALNRHRVMHGESWDYGTEINSLKAFSFLAFVGLHLPLVLDLPWRSSKVTAHDVSESLV